MNAHDKHFALIHANVALTRHPLDHESMQGFVSQIEEINALAQSTPGFISQPTPPDSGAVYAGSSLLNLSIWESVEALHGFTHSGKHAQALADRGKWFQKQNGPMYVLFWYPRGEAPSEQEIDERLAHLLKHGAKR